MTFKEIFDSKREVRATSMFVGLVVGTLIVCSFPPHTEAVVGIMAPFASILSIEYWLRFVDWVYSKLRAIVI